MEITVHVIHSFEPGSANPVWSEILSRLGAIMTAIDNLKAGLATLQDDVTKETAVDQAILVLVQGSAATIASLEQQLKDAIAAGDMGAVQAVADGLLVTHTTMTANAAALAAAVVANTPPAAGSTGGASTGSAGSTGSAPASS